MIIRKGTSDTFVEFNETMDECFSICIEIYDGYAEWDLTKEQTLELYKGMKAHFEKAD
jgi:hypothetical protein